MKKTIATTILFTLLAAAALLAQGPPPRDPAAMAQHRVSYLTTVLSLTSAQQQQATTIFTNAANAAASLRQSMRAAHEGLHTAVQNNDAAGIDTASAQIGGLMGQMTAIQSKAEAAFYQILTPEQQTKLNQIEKEGRRGFGFGGPEGPGPGGPGPGAL